MPPRKKERRRENQVAPSTSHNTVLLPMHHMPVASMLCTAYYIYYKWLTKLPPALQDTCWQRAQRPHAKNTDTKDSGVRTPTDPPTANLTPNSCLPVVAMAGAPWRLHMVCTRPQISHAPDTWRLAGQLLPLGADLTPAPGPALLPAGPRIASSPPPNHPLPHEHHPGLRAPGCGAPGAAAACAAAAGRMQQGGL